MTQRMARNLTLPRKLLLAAAGVAAVAGPVFIGLVHPPRSRAQSTTSGADSQAPGASLAFEVASIKPSDPNARGVAWQIGPDGGMRVTNVRLRQLIEFAYNVDRSQISGALGWFESEGFDVVAKPPPGESGAAHRSNEQLNQVRQRVQALLADRFQLVIHRETKEMPIYVLVVAKNGTKLTESTKKGDMGGMPGKLVAEGTPIDRLAQHLTGMLRRRVEDRTGLTGLYDFKLEWTPDPGGAVGKVEEEKAGGAPPPDPGGPSIFTALQQQVGLKLESQKGPVEFIVIERAARPSPN